MSAKRLIANTLLKSLGLRHLSGSGIVKQVRAVLDEIDLQHLRDANHCHHCETRTAMYLYLNEVVIGAEPIDYLEFGVHRGDSIREWCKNNKNPESRFYGFDSFEGLPEKWRDKQEAGHFDVGGKLPEIDDTRVSFVKGWFDRTIPPFACAFNSNRRLVIHLDADLYGSTMWPLIYLAPKMQKGTLLLFDELYDRNHEFKALQDFVKITRMRIKAVSEMENFGRACFEIQ